MSATEEAITALVDEFLDHPYLFRVEHSLHTRLYALLTGHRNIAQHVLIGDSGQWTQLVHKEWPETLANPLGTEYKRRGLFDIAILAPQQLEKASLEGFRQGRIDAPVVIELGLNYGFRHLKQDEESSSTARSWHRTWCTCHQSGLPTES